MLVSRLDLEDILSQVIKPQVLNFIAIFFYLALRTGEEPLSKATFFYLVLCTGEFSTKLEYFTKAFLSLDFLSMS